MPRSQHLGDTAALALAERRRAAGATELVHLSACLRCRERVDQLARLLAALRGKRTAPPRALLIRQLAAHCRLARSVAADARLVAARRPGAQLDAPEGLRSAAPAIAQWL